MKSTEPQSLLACQLTPGGRGAVATIGLRGDLHRIELVFRAANGRQPESQPLNRICFGLWGTAPYEEIVYTRTGPTSAEVHCHGGIAASNRILSEIVQLGGEVVDERAWLRFELDDESAECELALTRVTTLRTAHHLLRQSALWKETSVKISTMLNEDRRHLAETALKWSDFGIHLTVPWKIVLCGRPNVGKSSLINALVGYTRSIVYDQPGTTRDVVAVEAAFSGWPIELFDTAGLRETEAGLESAGIARARQQLSNADVVVVVLDATGEMHPEDLELLQKFPDSLAFWNKTDVQPRRSPGTIADKREITGSALTGTGVPELMQAIVCQIVPQEPPAGTLFPVSERQRQRLLSWLPARGS